MTSRQYIDEVLRIHREFSGASDELWDTPLWRFVKTHRLLKKMRSLTNELTQLSIKIEQEKMDASI